MRNAAPTPADRHTLVRLVRFLLHTGAGQVVVNASAPSGSVSIQRSDGAEKAFPQKSLKFAASMGLIGLSGTHLTCLPEAKLFLKRALGPDEDEVWREQHSDLRPLMRASPTSQVVVRLNLDESPLASLAKLKDKNGGRFLPQEALEAGNRLHADFIRAQLQPRITQSFSPRIDIGPKGNASDLTDSAIAARLRFNKAVTAMGPDLQGVAVDVCCFGKGLEMVEHERGWPQRSAKLMLRTALMTLHRYYNPPVTTPRAKMQHWGDEGFRPDLKR